MTPQFGTQIKKGFQVSALLLATAALSVAQVGTQAERTINAPLGAINYIEGQASLNGQPLSSQSVGSAVANANSVIDTGSGFVEVLLTPGAFLRIGHNSQVRMISAGLVNTRIGLTRGSALIEVADFVKGISLGVQMNGVVTQIDKNGLYKFDATQMTVSVLDGKAKVLEGSRPTTLSKGDQVLLASDNPAKRLEFNRKAAEEDPLYIWSKVRSQNESASNINVARNVAHYGGWNGAGWYWDPYWASYAFLPGYGYVGSPFGWGFYSPVYAYGGYGFYGGPFRGGFGAVHAAGGYHASLRGRR